MKKLLIILIVLLLSAPVFSATLEWDENEDADYYVVYWGAESGAYTGHSEDITGTSFTDNNMDGTKKYYAVKAFNSCGNSSDFSTEIEYCKPVKNTSNVKFQVEVVVTVNVE